MSRPLRFLAVAVALVLMSGTACKKNSKPEPPGVLGPVKARPGDTLTYRFTSTDPDGDSVFYMISWGGGGATNWSPANPSGEEYVQTHSYSDSGIYFIKAKAKDSKDAESAWSDSLRVRVGSFSPEAPVLPTGPTRCSTGLAYRWSTKAVHPLHDSVSIQFSWGDHNVDNWGPMVASNEYYEAGHTYSLPDTYKIAARARDALGFESPWSESLAVIVDTGHGTPSGAPRGLVLTAATDSTVKVAWFAPIDTGVRRYVVAFMHTGADTFDSVGWNESLLSYVHNPLHKTGKYQVTAVYDAGRRVPSIEAPSTAPVANPLQLVPELNKDSGSDAGYGWSRSTGTWALHDMTIAETASLVDFYFTDFAPGFAGPNYAVASPFIARQDPGGVGIIPPGNWHLNTFAYLDSGATGNDPLPPWSQSRYRDSAVLDTLPILVACHTEDGYFALINANSIDTTSGLAYIGTWFQLIRGLRLIQH